MRRFETQAYARAGLVGNPSDGYFGKTISFTIPDFCAKVVIYDWPKLEILPTRQDQVSFNSMDEMVEDVTRNGYYGGMPLVAASIKKFHEYCRTNDVDLPKRNFTIRYGTNIPRQVGLAGSSAIVTATWRALMKFFKVEISKPDLPNWILSTERDELSISAGLQDRVAQVYENLVYMDFDREKLESNGHGDYEYVDADLLPRIYLAYKVRLSEISGIVHSNLRQHWERGDQEVVDAMQEFANLTDQARECLWRNDPKSFGEILDANFDLRLKIMPVSDANIELVETARSCGASAKFAGSGGAIVGTFKDDVMFDQLSKRLTQLGCRVIQPAITNGI